MRSLGTRRAVRVAGAAALAAVALAGCSAGQVAETSLKRPSNMGVNQNNSDNSVAIRNLAVFYPGPAGYPAGASAALQVSLFNQTKQPVTVLISSQRPDPSPAAGVVYGTSVVLVGGPAASATAAPQPSASPSSAEPSTPAAGQPARITIAPQGYATFLPGDPETLRVQELSAKLVPGQSVSLTFEFSNGADPLRLPAPVATPMSPASRAPGIPNEDVEE